MDLVMRYKEIDIQAKAMAEREKVKIIKEACESGLSQTEIASLLGTNRKFIYRLLKKYQHAELEEINAIT